MDQFLKIKCEDGRVLTLDTKTGQLSDGEKKFAMDLTADDVHIQQALADAVLGFKLQDGIADEVVRVIPVDKQSDHYFIWDKKDTFEQVESINAAPGAQVPEIGTRLSQDQFSTRAYALAAFVPAEVEANADSKISPRRAAVRRLMNALTLAREYRLAKMLRDQANYGADFKQTLGATAKWNGGADADPVRNLYDRIEATGMPITSLIMSERSWHDFSLSPQVRGYGLYKDNVKPVYTKEVANELSALLGLPKIRVGRMKGFNKTSGALEYVWGDDVILTHEPAGEGLALDGQDIATAYTFRWKSPLTAMAGSDASMMPGGFFVRQYFAKERGPMGGTVIVVGHYDSDKFLSDFVSGLIVGAHQ